MPPRAFSRAAVPAVSLCALCASCGAVHGADLELYGAVELGFTYTHTNHRSKADAFEMSQNMYAGSYFGFRGQEKLGPNLTVGFVLENGFVPDTGAYYDETAIFDRESRIYLEGDWGSLGFGRFGAFSSGSPALGWYWDMEPFETGYIDAGVQATQINAWRLNSNAVYYISPVFKGFKVGLQYSFTGEAAAVQEAPVFADNNTFANLAVRWDGPNARALLGFEWERFGRDALDGAGRRVADRDDAWAVKLAGAWQPSGGALTLYAGASWYLNSDQFGDATWDDEGYDKIGFDPASGKRLTGRSAYAGVRYATGAANWLAMVQFLDGENKGAVQGARHTDFQRTVVSGGVHYFLSKRTMLYAVASLADGSGLIDHLASETATDRFLAHAGIGHYF